MHMSIIHTFPFLPLALPARRRGCKIVNQAINHFSTANKMKESTFIHLLVRPFDLTPSHFLVALIPPLISQSFQLESLHISPYCALQLPLILSLLPKEGFESIQLEKSGRGLNENLMY